MRKFSGLIITTLCFFVVMSAGVVGASTTTPQQKINVLLKDAKILEKNQDVKSAKKLYVEARKDRFVHIQNSSMGSEWSEMISYYTVAGDTTYGVGGLESVPRDIKRANYRAHELLKQFAKGDENRLEVTH